MGGSGPQTWEPGPAGRTRAASERRTGAERGGRRREAASLRLARMQSVGPRLCPGGHCVYTAQMSPLPVDGVLLRRLVRRP